MVRAVYSASDSVFERANAAALYRAARTEKRDPYFS